VEGYYLRAKDKEITLRFSNEHDEIMMMTDRNAIMQILENLISNAIKYSPLGKMVYVNVQQLGDDQMHMLFVREENARDEQDEQESASVRHLASPHSSIVQNRVRIEIQDEGPGMTAEDMQHLFSKFAKLSAKPTGGEHSTGLGLSIVKKVTEALEGRVWCESEPDAGATFIVELPITEVPPELLLERYS
jgi:signal transduction histidine kinase